jgi:hypothetical protein
VFCTRISSLTTFLRSFLRSAASREPLFLDFRRSSPQAAPLRRDVSILTTRIICRTDSLLAVVRAKVPRMPCRILRLILDAASIPQSVIPDAYCSCGSTSSLRVVPFEALLDRNIPRGTGRLHWGILRLSADGRPTNRTHHKIAPDVSCALQRHMLSKPGFTADSEQYPFPFPRSPASKLDDITKHRTNPGVWPMVFKRPNVFRPTSTDSARTYVLFSWLPGNRRWLGNAAQALLVMSHHHASDICEKMLHVEHCPQYLVIPRPPENRTIGANRFALC